MEVVDLAQTIIVRRVFEYATRIVRSFSAGGVSVIDPQDIANELIAAEREHKAIGQFSDSYPDLDLETAYRAQRAFVQSKLDAGERFVGYKLGLTSRNKQQAMGVDASAMTAA